MTDQEVTAAFLSGDGTRRANILEPNLSRALSSSDLLYCPPCARRGETRGREGLRQGGMEGAEGNLDCTQDYSGSANCGVNRKQRRRLNKLCIRGERESSEGGLETRRGRRRRGRTLLAPASCFINNLSNVSVFKRSRQKKWSTPPLPSPLLLLCACLCCIHRLEQTCIK